MRFLVAAVVAICAIGTSAMAAQEPASNTRQSVAPQECASYCWCGKDLSHITASLATQFKLVRACGLEWQAGCGGKCNIDLAHTQISLDRYKNGNLPHGEFLLSGSATLTGTLDYSPGPAGDIWFTVNGSPITTSGTVLSELVSELKLYADHPADKFHVPSVFQTGCWSATATIHVGNIRLLIGDTDEAGAYPSTYEVISTSDFKAHRCG